MNSFTATNARKRWFELLDHVEEQSVAAIHHRDGRVFRLVHEPCQHDPCTVKLSRGVCMQRVIDAWQEDAS